MALPNSPRPVEVDLDVLAEARGVVVSDRFGVSEGLQNWVCFENLVLHAAPTSRNGGEVLKALLRRLCFPGSRLPTDDDGLELLEGRQAIVGVVGYVKHVRSSWPNFREL